MDGINGIDACRFAVYFIVITNSQGKGQIVFGAYLRQEAGYSGDLAVNIAYRWIGPAARSIHTVLIDKNVKGKSP